MFAAAGGTLLRSPLPLWAALLPLLAGLALYLAGEKREKLRKAAALAVSALTLAGVVRLYPAVAAGAVEYRPGGFMEPGLYFRVDLAGWIFAVLIALVWFLAVLFSFAYMDREHNRRRYYSALIVTLGGTLGVVLAGDFFTLFLFFELMTFSSYLLVIHEEDRPAMQAGTLYLYLGVAGGLALLCAVLFLAAAAGTTEMVPLLERLSGSRTLVYILFLTGFGIKAGIVPVHIWLPQAHPAAPSPASALLSGVIIKTGAYGIFRVTLVLFTPAGDGALGGGWSYPVGLGGVLIAAGIITAFTGALMALFQDNAKRLLAYSSVSQIGYIVLGIGAAAFLGREGALGFAGSLYHIVNHAFFKAGLFMIVGTVFMFTRKLELSRLGGMARKMPFAALAFLVAAGGIAGVPGFNGYASKTLLHDALLEAYARGGHFVLYLAERLFIVTSALTVCYFVKLFHGLFLGPVPRELDRSYRLPPAVQATLASFSLVILALGLFPNLFLEKVILPVAASLGFAGHGLEHLAHFHFFDRHPLAAMLVVAVLAAALYLPGALWGWFNWTPPPWLSIHYLIYRPLAGLLLAAVCRGGSLLDGAVGWFYDRSGAAARRWCGFAGDIDCTLDHLYALSGRAARGLAERAGDLDRGLDRVYESGGRLARKLAEKSGDLDRVVDSAYDGTGRAARRLAERAVNLDRSLNRAYEKAGAPARLLLRRRAEPERQGEKRRHPAWWIIERLLLLAVLTAIIFVIIYCGK